MLTSSNVPQSLKNKTNRIKHLKKGRYNRLESQDNFRNLRKDNNSNKIISKNINKNKIFK